MYINLFTSPDLAVASSCLFGTTLPVRRSINFFQYELSKLPLSFFFIENDKALTTEKKNESAVYGNVEMERLVAAG